MYALHPFQRMGPAVLLMLAAPLRAQEPPAAATPPATPGPSPGPSTLTPAPAAATAAADTAPRYEDLIVRQRALEEQLRAQQQLIDRLQRAVALPPFSTDTPAIKHLAVPPKAVSGDDPELLAPMAGYSDKSFFVRDRHSWFVFVPKGCIHIDYYNFFNRGDLPPGAIPNATSDPRIIVRDTIFIRRAGIGLAGTIARGIDFRFENDFASQPLPGQYGTLDDADVVINYSPYIKSAPVRYVVPNQRDLGGMLLGDFPRASGRWYAGIFNGDGANFKNLDNSPALISRAYFAPVALVSNAPKWAQLVWVGGSIWWQPTTNLGGSAAPSTTGPPSATSCPSRPMAASRSPTATLPTVSRQCATFEAPTR